LLGNAAASLVPTALPVLQKYCSMQVMFYKYSTTVLFRSLSCGSTTLYRKHVWSKAYLR